MTESRGRSLEGSCQEKKYIPPHFLFFIERNWGQATSRAHSHKIVFIFQKYVIDTIVFSHSFYFLDVLLQAVLIFSLDISFFNRSAKQESVFTFPPEFLNFSLTSRTSLCVNEPTSILYSFIISITSFQKFFCRVK